MCENLTIMHFTAPSSPQVNLPKDELKGYVRIPKKEKNLKSEWEKRYLSYSVMLHKFFLSVEVW